MLMNTIHHRILVDCAKKHAIFEIANGEKGYTGETLSDRNPKQRHISVVESIELTLTTTRH